MVLRYFRFRVILLTALLFEFGLTIGVNRLYRNKDGTLTFIKTSKVEAPPIATVFDSAVLEGTPLFDFWNTTSNEALYTLDDTVLADWTIRFDDILGWAFQNQEDETVPLYQYLRKINIFQDFRGPMQLQTTASNHYATVKENSRSEQTPYQQRDVTFQLTRIVAFVLPGNAGSEEWRAARNRKLSKRS